MELLDLRFRVGILGSFPEDESQGISKSIELLIGKINKLLSRYQSTQNCFTENPITIDLYTCPYFIGDEWLNIFQSNFGKIHMIVPNRNTKNKIVQEASTITSLNIEVNNIGTIQSMINWIGNQIDIAILVWDGDETSNDGYLWRFIEVCKYNHIPCIWINNSNSNDIFWYERFYYEEFNEEILDTYIEQLYGQNIVTDKIVNDTIFLSKLWRNFYSRFADKHKIRIAQIMQVEDELVKLDYKHDLTDNDQILNYEKLRAYYRNYDTKACNIAGNYREVFYFCSILPFLSTIFLSIGLYCEVLIGYFYDLKFLGFRILTLIAGIGFLMQAAFNSYTYYLGEDNNKSVKKSKMEYLNSRYIAEYFRNAIHFLNFGIVISCRKKSYANMDKTINMNMADITIHHMVSDLEPVNYEFNQMSYRNIITHLKNMIDNQIGYHTGKKEQLKTITTRLKLISKITFWIGFIFVAFRGGFQFGVAFLQKYDFLQSNNSDIAVLKSFTNMLALILPAWASYFALKLSMNNFEGLLNHSEDALKSLIGLRSQVINISEKNYISYDMIYSLSEDIMTHQISELNNWYNQTMGTNN